MILSEINRRVSLEELKGIFELKDDRSIFISTYANFGSDGNDKFYDEYIDRKIDSGKYNEQQDAIELSIATRNFKPAYLEIVKEILHSRRKYFIKLLCLDWLFCFFSRIPKQYFSEVNEYSLKSNNELLKIQSILNLLLLDGNSRFLDGLIKLLKKSNDSAVFYRISNGMDEIALTQKFSNKAKEEIIAIVKKKKISERQKEELIERLGGPRYPLD